MAVLTSCSNPKGSASYVAGTDCGDLPPGYHYANDEWFWSQQPKGVEPPFVNVIKVDGSGRLTWNESTAPVTEAEVDDYLRQMALMGSPYIAIDFKAGTPCVPIQKVRALMNKHLLCAESRKCLQGDYRAWVQKSDR
jgi:hypothetical protein